MTSTPQHGAGTVGTSARALAGECAKLEDGLTIKAGAGNLAKVLYVGGPEVTSANGLPLSAGQEIRLAISSPWNIYVVGSASGTAFSWIGS